LRNALIPGGFFFVRFVVGGFSAMRKTVGIVVLLLCVTASMGCIFKGNSLPAQGSELQMAMDTTATYDVIGPAEGEYTRGYLFSFIHSAQGLVFHEPGYDRCTDAVPALTLWHIQCFWDAFFRLL